MNVFCASNSQFLKNKGGIYKITCIINGKFYIGSSKNLYKRIKYCHILDLCRGRHHNKHLQSAWIKYGKENFIFEILEFVEGIKSLREREYFYIFKFKALNREVGYNMWKSYYSTDRESLDYKKLEYYLLTPENKIIKGTNVYTLTKEYNIPGVMNMIKFIKGEKRYYKNWINLNNPPPTIKLLSPRDIIYEVSVYDLEKFAKFHKIRGTNIFKRLSLGEWKHIHGWRMATNKNLKYINIISPNGETFTVIKGKYSNFCKRMNIDTHIINRLQTNKSGLHKSGWRLQNCG